MAGFVSSAACWFAITSAFQFLCFVLSRSSWDPVQVLFMKHALVIAMMPAYAVVITNL